MGAEMIGYTLFGPEKIKLSDARRKKLLAQAEKIVEACKLACTQYDDESGEGFVDVGSGYFDSEKLTEDQKKLLANMEAEDCERAAMLNPSVVLAEFVGLWNGNFHRDSCDRLVEVRGRTYKILFAGGESWGDEPDGTAHQAVKEAYAFDFPQALGCH